MLSCKPRSIIIGNGKEGQTEEIVEVEDKWFDTALGRGKDGSIRISVNEREGVGPTYGLDARIRTAKKVRIGIDGTIFNLSTRDSESWRFDTSGYDVKLFDFFGKNTTVKIEIEGKAPLVTTFYFPMPLHIISPASVQQNEFYDLTKDSVIKWIPDSRQGGNILVNIGAKKQTSGREQVHTIRIVFTPDDGVLYLKDLSPYLPKDGNGFTVGLCRSTKMMVSLGAKKYDISFSSGKRLAYKQ